MGIFVRRNNRNNNRGRGNTPTWPIYILLVVLFAAYLIFQKDGALSVIIGGALFFVIISLLVVEVLNGIREQGMFRNILEIIIAVVAVVAFWYILMFVLGTNSPLDVVPSCSMLPALQRGDMILLQGVNQNNIAAPIVNVSQAMWNNSFGKGSASESLQCVAYNINGSAEHVSQFVAPGDHIGLLLTANGTQSIVNGSYQRGSLVQYSCGAAPVKYQNGSTAQIAYTNSITISTGINGSSVTIAGDRNNSIIVYQTVPQDLFYKEGDAYIVHRAYAILNVSGQYYVLTKGDNNPGLDVQYFNYPAKLSQVEGKVIGSVPYLGYLKLILSSSFSEPTGCNFTIQN